MDNLTEKLNNFTSLVLDDAKNKRDDLMNKIQLEHDSLMNSRETEFLEEAYEAVQHGITEAKRAANEKVLHTELEAKKQLLAARESIVNSVLEGASVKLKEFTQSDEYEAWLLKKIGQAVLEVGNGHKTVYVTSADFKFKNKIEAIEPDQITVDAVSEKDFIGGVKVFNPERRVSVDYTFKEMLADEKKSFLQRSGLTIE